jgi:hypothetical protein
MYKFQFKSQGKFLDNFHTKKNERNLIFLVIVFCIYIHATPQNKLAITNESDNSGIWLFVKTNF